MAGYLKAVGAPSSAGADRVSPARIAAARARVPQAFAYTARPGPGAVLAVGLLAALLAASVVRLDLAPASLGAGLQRLGPILQQMLRPSAGGALAELGAALLQSLAMAFLGTLIASVIAFPLALLAARNIVASRLVRFSLRRHFDALRGIDALVWALVYVRALGLGPLAGVLAIATSDTGTLAKLFAEAIEHAESGQADAVRAAGANRLQLIRLGLLPQVLPVMLSSALYMFESNTRSATILGIVGAGGIGFQLADRVRAHRWDEVSFIILMIVAAVACVDLLSHRLRHRLIDSGARRRSAGRCSERAV